MSLGQNNSAPWPDHRPRLVCSLAHRLPIRLGAFECLRVGVHCRLHCMTSLHRIWIALKASFCPHVQSVGIRDCHSAEMRGLPIRGLSNSVDIFSIADRRLGSSRIGRCRCWRVRKTTCLHWQHEEEENETSASSRRGSVHD
jgi:hypothetical protein